REGHNHHTSSAVSNVHVEPTFDVDVGDLKRRFLRLQQAVHPDGFAAKGEKERRIADDVSAFINRAYNTLRDPMSRALYMLGLNGITIDESESLQTRSDLSDLLMHVLDVRERLEEAPTQSEVDEIQKENDGKSYSLIIHHLPPPLH
ncbi:hypothetical protein HK102_013113, partial [Quaeritorhiza haematococci]